MASTPLDRAMGRYRLVAKLQKVEDGARADHGKFSTELCVHLLHLFPHGSVVAKNSGRFRRTVHGGAGVELFAPESTGFETRPSGLSRTGSMRNPTNGFDGNAVAAEDDAKAKAK